MYYQRQIHHERPFPVAENFFQPVNLTQERLNELRESAARAIQKTLLQREIYQRTGEEFLASSSSWRLHARHENLSEYKRPHRSHPNVSLSCVVGKVNGNYRDIAWFYKSETREQYFNIQKKLFNDTVDAAVLYNVPQQRESSVDGSPIAYEGVKWVAVEPFALRFRMDSCHFESSGMGIDATGKPYAFRVILPLQLPELPDFFKTKRTVRMESKSVMILSPSGMAEQSTEVFVAMQNDFKYNRVPRSLYKRYLMRLHDIASLAAGKRNSTHYHFAQTKWKPVNTSRDCSVCGRGFSLLRSSHQCSMCSERVCRKCLVKNSDVLSVKPSRSPLQKVTAAKVCAPCGRILRDEADNVLDTPMLGEQHQFHEANTPMHDHRTMSEDSIPNSRTSTCSSVGSFSWAVTPRKLSDANSRGRFGTDRTELSSLASPIGSESIALDSPIATMISSDNFDDIIFEEDSDIGSQRSVVLTIDTSEMERVRTSSDPTRSASSSVSESIQAINSSILEQEILLRQLQRAAGGHGARRGS